MLFKVGRGRVEQCRMDMNKCDESEDAAELSIFTTFKYKAKCRNGDKVIAGNYRRKAECMGRRYGYH
jgi:hypothetical protein